MIASCTGCYNIISLNLRILDLEKENYQKSIDFTIFPWPTVGQPSNLPFRLYLIFFDLHQQRRKRQVWEQVELRRPLIFRRHRGISEGSWKERGVNMVEEPFDGLAVGAVAEFPGELEDASGAERGNSDSETSSVYLGVSVLLPCGGGGCRSWIWWTELKRIAGGWLKMVHSLLSSL
ncbi:unnamed protein product [Lactuca saligna]|uniref:Uncharacterized protein n=1 Tax=Lactuca saligna TaxID=75948 RepID=A0AA36DUT9_LACSI|nr:unnamed protein product [Lactuca saligna]